MKTFEKYLEEICWRIHPDILDDDMSDFLDDWMGSLEIEQCVKYAELYGKECYFTGKEDVLKAIKQ